MRNVEYFLKTKKNIWFEYDYSGKIHDLFGCPTWFLDYIDDYNSNVSSDEYDFYKDIHIERAY